MDAADQTAAPSATASADVVVDPSVSEPTSLPATTTGGQLPDATSQPQTHAAEPAQTTSLDPSEQNEQQASQPLLAATTAVDPSTAQTAPAPPTEPVPSIVEQPNVQELQQQTPATDTTHPSSAEAAPAQVAAQSTEPMSTSLPQASDTHAAEGLAAAPAADSATQPDLQVADAPQQASHAPEVPSSATQEPASTTANALSEIAPAATADLSAPASDPTPSVVPQPEAAPASAQLPEPVADSATVDAKQAGDAASAPKEAPAQPEHPPTTVSAVPAEAVPSLGESAPAASTDVPNPVEAPAASADSMAETAASASVPVDTTLNTSAPQTPQKKAASEASLPSTPTREGRVALLLRINKELIRLCVELQAKQLVSDPVYREAAVRLQANLGYLAGIADKSGKNTDASRPTAPSAALPKLESFPRSEHVPASPVAALYDKLIAMFGTTAQESPVAEGKKRSRGASAAEDEERKTAPSRGAASQDVSAAGTPSSNPPDTQAVQTPSSQPTAQQPAPPGQDQGKGPDLSLAPPVPIVPPGAAQAMPNNPQAQALMQAFGPNALVNLHALQSHLRGQGTHPWVAYMEANMAGFKTMPLQVQLQHMTSLQNAASQRQKGQASTVASPSSAMNGGAGISSPAARPVSGHSNSPGQPSPSFALQGAGPRTGTPTGQFQQRPGSSGSVGSTGGRAKQTSSALDPSQLQGQSPASGQDSAQPMFGFQPPAAASPGQQQQPQPQQGQQMPGLQGMPGMPGMPNFQNLPPHLQQQIRQQYMAHLHAQGMSMSQGFSPQAQQPQQPQQPQQGWDFQSPQ
ncbi:hypothetical protein PaG_06240 [Moesziomyces aphidis]|uniref:Uncharacterized protein n=1 Tax=Moesziomyces aphidis TaxID=84754 RepID=W3VDW5_MOEAP|nr:hypothetical protein PaG_06240 [Moesziomyces aphidis]